MSLYGLPIIAIAGQSNADGRADIVNVNRWPTYNYHTAYVPVSLIEKHEESVTDPLSWDLDRGPTALAARGSVVAPRLGTIGVEMSLARRLNETYSKQHAITKMCIGASGLASHWLPTAEYPENVPNLFHQWIVQMSAAEGALNGHIAGVIWIQGETDANDEAQAAAYEENLTALIAEMRRYFPYAFWAFNRLSSQASSVPHRATIRTAQTNVAANVSNCFMVNCDDLGITGQHFTGTGYHDLGVRFADTIQHLV